MRRTFLSATSALIAALTLSGCSGAGSVKDGINRADVRYSNDIVRSHQQALGLSQIARAKSTDPTVLQVTSRDDIGLRPEIRRLSGLLKSWGETPVSYDPSRHSAEANDPLIQGKNELSALRTLSGPEFNRAFLLTALAHNREYVAHAEKQLDVGRDLVVREIAESIAAERANEIVDIESALNN